MLAQGPHRHLVHTSGGKQIRGDALGHHGERQPGEELVGVVGAGDVAKRDSNYVKSFDEKWNTGLT